MKNRVYLILLALADADLHGLGIARAVQDLRRESGLELDDRIELWVIGAPPGRSA